MSFHLKQSNSTELALQHLEDGIKKENSTQLEHYVTSIRFCVEAEK